MSDQSGREWAKGLNFSRYFTQQGRDPYYANVTWEQRDSLIHDSQGRVLFHQTGVTVPKFWSQMATDIAASKYFRQRDVPRSICPEGKETSVIHMFERVVTTLLFEGEKQNLWESDDSAQIFADELRHLLVHQFGSFNSPVWFNCGLSHCYGIKSQMKTWYWDDDLGCVKEGEDAFLRPQSSACFILSVKDDLTSIFELALKEARIFKYGSGSGTNFSTLRGKQEELAGGGFSSGLLAFLDVLDRGAAATKSGGVTRRAAKMVCLDVDHPEILDFIRWKYREEEKARGLLKAGFSGGLDGEVYHTISGQNSNNSMRVTDSFMEAVLNKGHWETKSRTTGEVIEIFEAQDIWDEILKAIWHCGDPGIQFDSTIQSWHTVPASGPIRASNPCSEFMFLDDSGCNLASLNLARFFNEATGVFDLEGLRSAVRVFITAQEIWVGYSSYPTPEIVINSQDFRPLGLGFANLGGLLMRMGLAYDSKEGRSWAGAIAAWIQAEALSTSVNLAEVRGAFVGYSKNRMPVLNVISRHQEAAEKLLKSPILPKNMREGLSEKFSLILEKAKRVGIRNAQVTAVAPTGTIGLLMDCDTTGIEPEYALVKMKTLAGGGAVRQVNQALPVALRRLGYSTIQSQEILDYVLKFGHLGQAPILKSEHTKIFECASFVKGELGLRPEAHLEMMEAVQPFVSGAISKTVNLPEWATTEDIGRLLLMAWKKGLKAISIYRDGSKFVQPLCPFVCIDPKSSSH
ncbi:MAG: vitamin B12-dependent ribonucleotide reductase [Bdellovibrionales bacterium]|nr:vitamin B12-dependent ribonucleotide reductase [Bdellovibrionales bacterium]